MKKRISKGKTIRVKDDKGNEHKVRVRTVGDINIKKNKESKQIDKDPFQNIYSPLKLLQPPFNLEQLSMMSSNSSELKQCIEAMEINIEGFGHRYIPRLDKKDREKFKDVLEDELEKLDLVFGHINPDVNLTMLRRQMRKDLEQTGNGYFEIVRDDNNDIHSIYLIESYSMRLSKSDTTSTEMKVPYLKKDYTIGHKTFRKRFRRFCQIRGTKKVWFKEYGDTRVIDHRSGDVINDPASVKSKYYATEVIHFKLFDANSAYGVPRYIGNLFSILGSRASDEINFLTFQNNNIPAMAVIVNNAMLTAGSIERIEEFVENHVKNSANRSAFLILEAEPIEEGGGDYTGNMKIQMEDLTKSQTNDQLFQEYDKNNSEKVRRSFRLPPIFIGKSEDYNRATAEASRKLADEQIFAPEREIVDFHFNNLLLDLGIRYFTFKSNSANVTDDEDLINILGKSEKAGGMTPNLAREILSDILNRDIPAYIKEDISFDPNEPFSITMAERVKNLSGEAPNQGQLSKPNNNVVEEPMDKLDKILNGPNAYIDSLFDIDEILEKYLDNMVYNHY